MTKVTVFLIGTVTMIALILYGGLVLSFLWLWFIVPLGVHPVGIAQAIGITIFVASFTYRFAKNDDNNGVLESLISAAFLETLLLVLGYIVHLFV